MPSLEVIAKKKWEAFLFNNFSAKERAFLSQKMRIPNSAVYEYLQRFRSDYNLNELQVSLNSYFGELNLPKDNDDSSRSRSNPRKISNETNQSSVCQFDYIKIYVLLRRTLRLISLPLNSQLVRIQVETVR